MTLSEVIEEVTKMQASEAVVVPDSRQGRNGPRWQDRPKRSAMLYVMVMKAILVHLWMARSWKAIHIR